MLSIVCAGVVYIDGIPIESTALDAGTSGLKGEEKSDPAAIAALDPRSVRPSSCEAVWVFFCVDADRAVGVQLFDKYDADGSGGIDFDEFRVLLHDLNVHLSEPKALAYFKKCDKLRRGFISFEEFRLALYTCDPKNPSRTAGFAPGQSLSPKDLFEMFDKNERGAINREMFVALLAFMGKKVSPTEAEAIFADHEDVCSCSIAIV